MTPGLRKSLFVAASLSTAGAVGLVGTSTQTPIAPVGAISVVMHSVDGSTITCPAQNQTFDLINGSSVLTIYGLACAADSVFRNGFEVAP